MASSLTECRYVHPGTITFRGTPTATPIVAKKGHSSRTTSKARARIAETTPVDKIQKALAEVLPVFFPDDADSRRIASKSGCTASHPDPDLGSCQYSSLVRYACYRHHCECRGLRIAYRRSCGTDPLRAQSCR